MTPIYELMNLAETLGVRRERLLESAEFPKDYSLLLINFRGYIRLALNLIFINQDEFMGWIGTRKIKPGTYVLLTHAVIGSSSIIKLLDRFVFFHQFLVPEIGMRITNENDEVALEVTQPSQSHCFYIIELAMLVWWRFFRWCCGINIPLKRVEFQHTDKHFGYQYSSQFGCQPTFSAGKNRMILDSRYLDYMLVRTDLDLEALLSNISDSFSGELSPDTNYSKMIRAKIISGYPNKIYSLRDIASWLNKSSQSVRRYLANEDTNFQTILIDAKKELAERMLVSNDIPIKTLASQLGFSDVSSFHRSFKQWTGYSPKDYRDAFQLKNARY